MADYRVEPTLAPHNAIQDTWNAFAPTSTDWSLPSLPSFQPSTINAGDWTYTGFGGTSYPNYFSNPNIWDPSYYAPSGYGITPSKTVDQKQVKDAVAAAATALGQTYSAPSMQVSLPSGGTGTYAGGGLAIGPDGKYTSVGNGIFSSPPGGYGSWSQVGSSGMPSGYTDAGGGLAIGPDGKYTDAGGFSSGGSTSTGGGCYITTAALLGHEEDDGPTLTALRWFRDSIMGGRSEVSEYYETAPGIVAWIDAHPKRARIYQIIRRRILMPCVSMIKRGDFQKTFRLYKRMVRYLEARAHG